MRPLWPSGIESCSFFPKGNPLGPKGLSILTKRLWISRSKRPQNGVHQAILVIHSLSSIFTANHYI